MSCSSSTCSRAEVLRLCVRSCPKDGGWTQQWQVVHRGGLEHRVQSRQGGRLHVQQGLHSGLMPKLSCTMGSSHCFSGQLSKWHTTCITIICCDQPFNWHVFCVLCPACFYNAVVCHLQTIAEKKGWELSKAEGFELVTIMPSLVLGPVTGVRADGTSINAFKVANGLICSTLTASTNNETNACRLSHATCMLRPLQ